MLWKLRSLTETETGNALSSTLCKSIFFIPVNETHQLSFFPSNQIFPGQTRLSLPCQISLLVYIKFKEKHFYVHYSWYQYLSDNRNHRQHYLLSAKSKFLNRFPLFLMHLLGRNLKKQWSNHYHSTSYLKSSALLPLSWRTLSAFSADESTGFWTTEYVSGCLCASSFSPD